MRFVTYLCVFGVLAGCHALIDPEEDYLRPEDGVDAGPRPTDDAGSLDVGSPSPPECVNVVTFNRTQPLPMPRCCTNDMDCRDSGMAEFVCVNSSCGMDGEQHAGICVRIPIILSPPNDMCLIGAQCDSGVCSEDIEGETSWCGTVLSGSSVCVPE